MTLAEIAHKTGMELTELWQTISDTPLQDFKAWQPVLRITMNREEPTVGEMLRAAARRIR